MRNTKIVLLSLAFGLLLAGTARALDLTSAKSYFLNADYAASIKECEKILAQTNYSPEMDSVYYILGLSYLKEGNYLRAEDIFEIIIEEFPKSSFIPNALLSWGDAAFLRGNYTQARTRYQGLLKEPSYRQMRPQAYFRLSKCATKEGDTQNAQMYLMRLAHDFPESASKNLGEDDLFKLDKLYYSIQVGFFYNKRYAHSLIIRLGRKGYRSYLEETPADTSNAKSYRVKVGKFRQYKEALAVSKKLAEQGYPTKITP